MAPPTSRSPKWKGKPEGHKILEILRFTVCERACGYDLVKLKKSFLVFVFRHKKNLQFWIGKEARGGRASPFFSQHIWRERWVIVGINVKTKENGLEAIPRQNPRSFHLHFLLTFSQVGNRNGMLKCNGISSHLLYWRFLGRGGGEPLKICRRTRQGERWEV